MFTDGVGNYFEIFLYILGACYLIGLRKFPNQAGYDFVWSGSNTLADLSALDFDDGDLIQTSGYDSECVCLQQRQFRFALVAVDCNNKTYILCDDWKGKVVIRIALQQVVMQCIYDRIQLCQ